MAATPYAESTSNSRRDAGVMHYRRSARPRPRAHPGDKKDGRPTRPARGRAVAIDRRVAAMSGATFDILFAALLAAAIASAVLAIAAVAAACIRRDDEPIDLDE